MEDPDTKPIASGSIAPALTGNDVPQKGDVLVIEQTRGITIAEHETTFLEAIRQWPKALGWAFLFCVAVVMAGFDAQIITTFFALPAFQQRFGYEYNGQYIIPAPWQMALNMVSSQSGKRQ
jgi:hypothetical protein